MKTLTRLAIVIGTSAVVLYVAETAATADPPSQAKSAPLQVTVAPLAVSSAPPAVTFAPPRAAPDSATAANPPLDVQQVTARASPKNLLPSQGGYQRVVIDGKEKFCRNDLATGSHAVSDPVCLTADQWKTQQLRAAAWMHDAEHRAAAMPANPVNIGGLARMP